MTGPDTEGVSGDFAAAFELLVLCSVAHHSDQLSDRSVIDGFARRRGIKIEKLAVTAVAKVLSRFRTRFVGCAMECSCCHEPAGLAVVLCPVETTMEDVCGYELGCWCVGLPWLRRCAVQRSLRRRLVIHIS